jgi:hypothetical protein
MRFLLAVALSAACALPACANETTSDTEQSRPAPVDERNAASLREATYLEASLPPGAASITVQYVRKPEYKRVPYLAVEVLAPSAPGAGASELQEITIKGEFPGTPRLIVVDEQFNVLAATTSARQPDGSSLATTLAPRQGKRMVIVHDSLWSLPMSYDLTVGR